jgi:hypothetical protein
VTAPAPARWGGAVVIHVIGIMHVINIHVIDIHVSMIAAASHVCTGALT